MGRPAVMAPAAMAMAVAVATEPVAAVVVMAKVAKARAAAVMEAGAALMAVGVVAVKMVVVASAREDAQGRQCSSAGSPRNPNRSPARQHTPGPQPDLSSMTTLCRTA